MGANGIDMLTVNNIKEKCIVTYGNMMLLPLNKGHIEKLRNWRNDDNQTEFLRRIDYITEEKQLEWFQKYCVDETQIVFAIYENEELNRMVGSVALYNIDLEKRTSEVGRIQIGDHEAHGKGLGRTSLVGAIKVAFQCLGIRKIEASVHKDNIAAHRNDMKIGFRIVGEVESVVGGKEDLIEMYEEDAIRANEYYHKIDIKA